MFDLDDFTFDRGLRATAADLLETIMSMGALIPLFNNHQIGRGVRNYHKGVGTWSGADIREMNARNGVGSSKLRAHRQSALTLEH